MTYRILSPALDELSSASGYYEGEVKGLGLDFLDEFEATVSRILDFPKAWSMLDENFHHCNFRKFPYTVIYKIEDKKDIIIVSVFHLHREPLTWKDNL